MTRKELSRALAVNAMTKPVNVVIPASVLTAGLLLAVPWLVPVALVCWLALVAMTFFDEREAQAGGGRARATIRPEPRPPRPQTHAFPPEIAARVCAARAARASIRLAAGESSSPLEDVTEEVEALVRALDGHAARAQRMRAFLAEES